MMSELAGAVTGSAITRLVTRFMRRISIQTDTSPKRSIHPSIRDRSTTTNDLLPIVVILHTRSLQFTDHDNHISDDQSDGGVHSTRIQSDPLPSLTRGPSLDLARK